MKAHNNEQGVTLVELMVAIAIIGVVIAAIYMSYFTAVRVFGFNQDKVEFHREHRLIIETIGKYIRSANEININSTELLIKYDSSTKKVKLYKDENTNYFYIDNNPDDSGGERKVTQLSLSDLNFSKVDELISIKITLNNDNGDNYTFEEKFHPRIKTVVLSP
ncbi:PilW family protein [Halanaerobium sp.]|uniref:PilW family protein n=1 Tax=Halanaerobium sp. TaxID=1895664 RepID=UPI0025BD5A18|nr:prepilin-type N-terminal cleavage/methylation domain-containing protein [Halanaerobium sp.]